MPKQTTILSHIPCMYYAPVKDDKDIWLVIGRSSLIAYTCRCVSYLDTYEVTFNNTVNNRLPCVCHSSTSKVLFKLIALWELGSTRTARNVTSLSLMGKMAVRRDKAPYESMKQTITRLNILQQLNYHHEIEMEHLYSFTAYQTIILSCTI